MAAEKSVQGQKPGGEPNWLTPTEMAAWRRYIVASRRLLEALDAESTNDASSDNFVRLRPMEIQGEEVMTWRGIPIRDTDNLLNTETRLT